jgi:hypothetical protein
MAYTYGSRTVNEDGEMINYWYNYKHQLTLRRGISDGVSTVEETWYDKNKNVPSKIIATRSSGGSSYVLRIDAYIYDYMGNLISENHPVEPEDLESGEYVTSYIYDSPTVSRPVRHISRIRIPLLK